MNDKKSFQSELNALEKQIAECRIQYELFFNGIEGREPYRLREDTEREIRRLRTAVNTAADRFRLNTLATRLNTFKQYWNRVNLERENGTYFRDRMKLKRKMGSLTKRSDEADTQEDLPAVNAPVYSLEDLSRGDLGKKRKKKSGLSSERAQQLYQNFISSKQSRQESTDGLTFAAIQRKLNKQVAKLQEKGYTDIDFRVVVKDGKTSLKAVGKREK